MLAVPARRRVPAAACCSGMMTAPPSEDCCGSNAAFLVYGVAVCLFNRSGCCRSFLPLEPGCASCATSAERQNARAPQKVLSQSRAARSDVRWLVSAFGASLNSLRKLLRSFSAHSARFRHYYCACRAVGCGFVFAFSCRASPRPSSAVLLRVAVFMRPRSRLLWAYLPARLSVSS